MRTKDRPEQNIDEPARRNSPIPIFAAHFHENICKMPFHRCMRPKIEFFLIFGKNRIANPVHRRCKDVGVFLQKLFPLGCGQQDFPRFFRGFPQSSIVRNILKEIRVSINILKTIPMTILVNEIQDVLSLFIDFKPDLLPGRERTVKNVKRLIFLLHDEKSGIPIQRVSHKFINGKQTWS